MSENAGSRLAPAMTQPERNLWGMSTVLQPHATALSGHVIAEVWEDGFVCLAMNDARLAGAALAALSGAQPATTAARELPATPVMMERPGTGFAGRVIVEFAKGQAPAVAALGAEPARLVALTATRLQQAV